VHSFVQPQNYDQSKIGHFNDLLAEQQDIAVTHSTFLNATPETMDLISQGKYVLFMDEALDVLQEFNKTSVVENDPAQAIKKGDLRMLKEKGLIRVHDNCKVEWTGGEYGDSKFSELERLSKLGRVYLAKDKVMVCVFPPEMFALFERVYVMTYIFDGNSIKPYFDLFGIGYNMASVEQVDGEYRLCDYNPEIDRAFRASVQDLITVCDSEELNYKRSPLSKSWYDRHSAKSSPEIAELKGHLGYFFRKVARASATKDEIMWTCPTSHKDKLKGQGYTQTAPITKKEKEGLTEHQIKDLEKRRSCFVPLNAKATNDFRNRWALAYCYNMYYNSMTRGLFTANGVEFDDDRFALACLVQWVWRSRIRDGLPIHIYIPSARMRELFLAWLWEE